MNVGRHFPTVLLQSAHEVATVKLMGLPDFTLARASKAYAPFDLLLLCFTNRSGSTHLANIASGYGLGGRPNSFGNYEFFNWNAVTKLSAARGLSSFADYFAAIGAEHASVHGVVLCKVSIDQLAWIYCSGVLERMVNRLVLAHIARFDLVAQAVSIAVTSQTQEWTSLHATSAVEPVFDLNQIASIARGVADANGAAEMFYNLRGLQPERFNYESLIVKPAEVGSRLCPLFGMPVKDGLRPLDLQPQRSVLKSDWTRKVRNAFLAEMTQVQN
jgi:LPS sulfotransferase NodH